jgi:hypothetical protein
MLIGLAAPAWAEPTPLPTTPPDEGSTPTLDTLRSNLEAAAIGWLDAEAALSASKVNQVELQDKLTVAELDIARARVGIGKYAGEAYKTGRVGVLGVMLNATSPDDFLSKAMAFNKITQRDQVRLEQLADAKRRAAEAKLAIDEEIRKQTEATAEMAKRKTAAERALAAVGGGATRGWLDPNSRAATPAPRNVDGGWPAEWCSINDPTTAGCITPRTNHAMREAQKAGFTRYVSCFRAGNKWEHPKGRACDFSTNPSGFNGTAQGGDKDYGANLASFFVKNAIALGVMYVVWFCEIWHVGAGWRKYNTAGSVCGDNPSPDHTNHVHVSIY